VVKLLNGKRLAFSFCRSRVKPKRFPKNILPLLFGFLKFENVEKDNPNSLLHVQREQKKSTKHYKLFVFAIFKEKKEEVILSNVVGTIFTNVSKVDTYFWLDWVSFKKSEVKSILKKWRIPVLNINIHQHTKRYTFLIVDIVWPSSTEWKHLRVQDRKAMASCILQQQLTLRLTALGWLV